ncbi:endonuclease/exonuclease/phosphatase family metal-dependent hydrolase [Actinoplanes campanulatus]|uniref:Endonuclease/exonuclease/phosphatase family metal-dependent hydrolase n=1 Tax=Actinoplanes campanulatus TaxID=113559 RepID=A0A7W5FHD3_9ACTN|nr:endonuclease/exonuclease/phosphatase family protein [Actinoplanes campanulatus]MBB3098456.1 endonuclease/exonuclease/phosphatase family metal-dependent hydrolase [Actinoplanes campanulatus]GGN35307.1 endonuclease/exonuclease/phosphatase [Actinoplanes campanulatus]GID39149.1 endonuclease/exonuclease/phosphatase [Actinoplanes campanulatus]
MRLATFNLLHGRSLSDGTVHAGRIRTAIADLDADVLGLQEVDRAQPRSGLLDLTALAADALDATTHRFAAAVVGTPGQTWEPWHSGADIAHPQYGIALVSRYPVDRWQITELPGAPVRSPVLAPDGGLLLLRDEPRVLLAAVVQTPSGPMTVATTHLSFVPGWNVRQLRHAVRALRALPAPRVLLGDLNMPAGPVRAFTGWRPLARAATFPSPAPKTQLDHVLADPRGVADLGRVVQVRTPSQPISDHRPLVVRLDRR